MARYDEDLHENPFFNTLVTKYNAIFSEAAEKKWMIFVPRVDSVQRLKMNKTDFENHIFCQKAGGEAPTTLLSCNGKVCAIVGDIMTTEQGYKEQRTVRILFEECFYNSRDESYQVFCLEQPLEGTLTEDAGVAVVKMDSYQDCCNYLWRDPVTEKVKKLVDNLLEFFQMEHGGSLRTSMDAASAVYTRAVQEVLKFRQYQSSSQRNFCKLAVETYVMAGLHKKIYKEICFLVAHRDATLNKITRNLIDIPPEYLGIKAQFRLSIPEAKKVLSKLNQLGTPLEKMICLRECVSVFTQLPLEGHFDALTADELLPILVYLVIISDVPNWHGNMAYINNFHFSRIGVEEFAYNVTSFEAAVEYIAAESSQLANMDRSIKILLPAVRKRYTVHGSSSSSSNNVAVDKDENLPISQFFKAVSEGDVKRVSSLLRQAEEEARAAKDQLCHPLCNCRRCIALEDRQMDDSHRVTVFSRDVDGRTALHIAARIGNTELVCLLLEQGALVTATDHNGSTPLHQACQKGHQRTVLLLLGEEESLINATDIHGNTCLHFACSNGHKECVKALLFHKDRCEMNATNAQGDTPLHNAARWGYSNIVSLLLEHKASTTIQNSRTETPAQCAQSRKVQELLFQARRKSDSEVVRSVSMKMKKLQPKRKSDSMSDATERHLKKLFRAINDDDTNFVQYLFGWSEVEDKKKLCHPLCDCDECIRLKKTTALGSNLTVDSSDGSGVTPVHRAAQLGRRRILQLLLSHGASVNSKTTDQLTPLHLASQYNHKDVVLLLLERSVEVNPQDLQGNTPLHFASQNGHMESATLLLIHGADVNMINNRGDTPLHSAAKWNHPIIVRNLLLYGALYTALNHNNQSPLKLTNNDEVQENIQYAATGVIKVGSYRCHIISAPPAPSSSPSSSSSKEALIREEQSSVDWTTLGSGITSIDLRRPRSQATSNVPSPRQQVRGYRNEREKQKAHLSEVLKAIESFDRCASLHHAHTDDRSAPLLTSTSSSSHPPPPPHLSSTLSHSSPPLPQPSFTLPLFSPSPPPLPSSPSLSASPPPLSPSPSPPNHTPHPLPLPDKDTNRDIENSWGSEFEIL